MSLLFIITINNSINSWYISAFLSPFVPQTSGTFNFTVLQYSEEWSTIGRPD